MLSTEDVLDILALPLIGLVPEDEKVVSATNSGEPVFYDKNSFSGEAFRRIAKRILGEDVEYMDLTKKSKIRELFKRLFQR